MARFHAGTCVLRWALVVLGACLASTENHWAGIWTSSENQENGIHRSRSLCLFSLAEATPSQTAIPRSLQPVGHRQGRFNHALWLWGCIWTLESQLLKGTMETPDFSDGDWGEYYTLTRRAGSLSELQARIVHLKKTEMNGILKCQPCKRYALRARGKTSGAFVQVFIFIKGLLTFSVNKSSWTYEEILRKRSKCRDLWLRCLCGPVCPRQSSDPLSYLKCSFRNHSCLDIDSVLDLGIKCWGCKDTEERVLFLRGSHFYGEEI